LTDGRRHEVRVAAGAEERLALARRHVHLGQFLHARGRLHFGQRRRQVQGREADVGGNCVEKRIDGIDADRRQHFGAVFGRVRVERHWRVRSSDGD